MNNELDTHLFLLKLKCGCIVEIYFPLQRGHDKPVTFDANVIHKCSSYVARRGSRNVDIS